jgi:hypothetical protein
LTRFVSTRDYRYSKHIIFTHFKVTYAEVLKHTFLPVTLALERCVDGCVRVNVLVCALYFDVIERLPKRTEFLVFKMLFSVFLKRKMTLPKAVIT